MLRADGCILSAPLCSNRGARQAFGPDDPDVATAVAAVEWLLHPSASSRPIATSEVAAHAFVSGAGAELELHKENEQAALLAKEKVRQLRHQKRQQCFGTTHHTIPRRVALYYNLIKQKNNKKT